MTPATLRLLRALRGGLVRRDPPTGGLLAAIVAGHARINEKKTDCYPERGTTYGLTAEGARVLREAELGR